MDSKRKRFQDELKRIRQLSAINKVLKKGDVENAFLNNTDKETEISKDTAVERMLEELQADKSERKDLALLDSLVTEEIPAGKAAKYQTTVKKAGPARKAPKPKKSSKRKR